MNNEERFTYRVNEVRKDIKECQDLVLLINSLVYDIQAITKDYCHELLDLDDYFDLQLTIKDLIIKIGVALERNDERLNCLEEFNTELEIRLDNRED